ncbi:unnamed protein product, partial [Ilex paraguariensis]
MGRLVLAFFILAEILLVQALANRYETSEPYPAKLRVRSSVMSEKMAITIADSLVSIGAKLPQWDRRRNQALAILRRGLAKLNPQRNQGHRQPSRAASQTKGAAHKEGNTTPKEPDKEKATPLEQRAQTMAAKCRRRRGWRLVGARDALDDVSDALSYRFGLEDGLGAGGGVALVVGDMGDVPSTREMGNESRKLGSVEQASGVDRDQRVGVLSSECSILGFAMEGEWRHLSTKLLSESKELLSMMIR